MAGRKRKAVTESELSGFKYFAKLLPLLERLHWDQCQRDRAGNRELHYDKYVLYSLLFLFNPTITSLRALVQASGLSKVQKRIGCKRTSLGSFSEAARVFDAELLKSIIGEVGKQLQPLAKDPRLKDVQKLMLVDSTLICALPLLVEAMWLKYETGRGLVRWQLHTHFEVERFIPERIDVTRDSRGECDERAVMEKNVESDRCYVMDRGFAKFALFNQIHTAGSSYVCRLRDNSSYEIVERRPLSDAAIEARIVDDMVVEMGASSKRTAQPNHRMRLVIIEKKAHAKHRSHSKTGPACDGYLRLATNLLDVPAEIIALLYQYRWLIEIFFRFLKQILGCRHLISHDQNGIQIQVYCAILACMLINLWTGRKPTKRTYEMLCYYFIGLATEEELLDHLAKLQTSRAK